MVILLLLTNLVAAPAAGGTVVVKATGKSTLQTKSRWHDLNISLTVNRQDRMKDTGLYLLAPPKLKTGLKWGLTHAQLKSLAGVLADRKWGPDDKDLAAYQKWQGTMLANHSLQSGGKLQLELKKSDHGYQVHFKGTVTSDETGHYGNRFGPNTFEMKTTHKVDGSVSLTKNGQITSAKLSSNFSVAGEYYTGVKGQNTELFEQVGMIELTLRAPQHCLRKLLSR